MGGWFLFLFHDDGPHLHAPCHDVTTSTQIRCGQFNDRMYKGWRRKDLVDGKLTLALGSDEHSDFDGTRAARRYE